MKIKYASMSNNYMSPKHIYRISYGCAIKINLLYVTQYLSLITTLKVMSFVKTVWRHYTQISEISDINTLKKKHRNTVQKLTQVDLLSKLRYKK